MANPAEKWQLLNGLKGKQVRIGYLNTKTNKFSPDINLVVKTYKGMGVGGQVSKRKLKRMNIMEFYLYDCMVAAGDDPDKLKTCNTRLNTENIAWIKAEGNVYDFRTDRSIIPSHMGHLDSGSGSYVTTPESEFPDDGIIKTDGDDADPAGEVISSRDIAIRISSRDN